MAGVAALGCENGLAFASKNVHRGSPSRGASEFRLKRCFHELFFVLLLLLKLGGNSRISQVAAVALDPEKCQREEYCCERAHTQGALPWASLQATIKERQAHQ